MKLPVVLLLGLFACVASAQSMYRWVDKDGKVHYSDRPPATAEAATVERKSSALLGADQTMSYALRRAVTDYPVTLYVQEDCAPCVEGRSHLNRRGIPFTEKNVATPVDIAALKALTGSDKPGLPVVQIGRKAVTGYLGSDWDSLLDASGYPRQPGR